MPADYRRGSRVVGRPATTATVFAAPGNEVADDLLRVRMQARRVTEPFTQERFAGYFAFAGLTDRRVMVQLHQAGVGWDDIAAYTGAGIGRDAFTRMANLGQHGVTAKVFTAWKPLDLKDDVLIALHAAGVTPEQARPYVALLPQDVDRKAIPELITAHINPTRVGYYQRYGVPAADAMLSLHRMGVLPRHVNAWRKTRPAGRRVIQDTVPELIAYVARIHRIAGVQADLTPTLVAHNLAEDDARCWLAFALPTRQVELLLAAGCTAEEVTENPHLATADEASLRLLASMRGSALDVPLGMVAV